MIMKDHLNSVRLAVAGMALAVFGGWAYSGQPSKVTVLTDKVPQDTIMVMTTSNLTVDDVLMPDERTLEFNVHSNENVEIGVTAPDDSTILVTMVMNIAGMRPEPLDSMPESVMVEMVNPSILTNGASHNSTMDAENMRVKLIHKAETKTMADAR